MGKTEQYSYSKLALYEGCGFKYKLKYLDKIQFKWTDTIATEFGTCIHSIEEDIAKAIKTGEPIDYISFKNRLIFKRYELEHKYALTFNELDKSSRTYLQKTYEYLESGIYRLENYLKEHPTYEVVGTEQYFSVVFEDVKFSGYIDRVLRDTATGKIIIHDIKSWAVPKEQKDLTTPLQFVIYVLAAKELYGVEPDQVECAYDLPCCNMIQPAGTKGFMIRGLKKIRELIAAIRSGEFKPKPSPLCHWCEYCPTNPYQPEEAKGKIYCPYHSLWTKQKSSFAVAETLQGLENHNIVIENYIKNYYTKTVL